MALWLSLYLLLLPCLFRIVATEKPTNLTVSDITTTCAFNATLQFNKELSALNVEYTSNGDALVWIGNGASEADSRQDCYVWASINFEALNMTFSFPSVDVKSTVSLGEGVAAKLETTVFWGSDYRFQNFSPTELLGPSSANAPLSAHLTNITETHPASCNAKAGRPYPYFEKVYIKTVFSVERENSTSVATGSIGPTLTQTFDITWIEGCTVGYRCSFDKNGFKVCYDDL